MEGGRSGHLPDLQSPFLAEARRRIRQVRCRDATITLLDSRGCPLRGLPVEVVQTRSAFGWGEQLWHLSTLQRHGQGESDRVRHFTRRFTDCLNSANCLAYWSESPRNDGPKHMEFQGEDRLDVLDNQVRWALQNGLTPKGHPVFWSIPKAYPEWLQKYPPATQWKFIEVRVRNLIARFRGRIRIWDLVNEALWEPAPENLCRRRWPHLEPIETLARYIRPILSWAREEDPDAQFLLNDYGLEADTPDPRWVDESGSPVTASRQRKRFVELFHCLQDAGCSPDGLGMQAHTGPWLTPQQQWQILDELTAAHVPLHVTEFWARADHLIQAGLPPEQAQAMRDDYIEQFITVAFSHPAVQSFYFWGDVVQSFGFRSDPNLAQMPTSSHEPAPLYHRLCRLLRQEWMTRLETRSDESGVVSFRGFLGDYSLRVRLPDGQQRGLPFTLTPDSPARTLTVHYPFIQK